MRIIKDISPIDWARLRKRPQVDPAEIRERVLDIFTEVRLRGDEAIRTFSLQFDKVDCRELRVTPAEFDLAELMLPDPLKKAIQSAAEHISQFHAAQWINDIHITTSPGVRCSLKYVPIERVGLYIPGGSAPLFSTVIMLGIPAVKAGCSEIVLCTPPQPNGEVHPDILYAARYVGLSNVFKVGGAQAIAAMTFGTESIPAIDKLFGPGNQYVAKAKQIATEYGVAADLPAGPSELLVIADRNVDPSHVAADLLSQSEHGIDSQVILVTDSPSLAEKVNQELERQLPELSRAPIAAKSLEQSFTLVVSSLDEGMTFANYFAPEHLILSTGNNREWASKVKNAGSVFLGPWSPVSAGDYASGTNHTLPTGGAARAFGGITLQSFMKTISFQELTREGLEGIASTVILMAEAEKLDGHSRAVKIRLQP